MSTPSLPFRFTKTYGLSLTRGTIFTASATSNDDSWLISWPAAFDVSICKITYHKSEVIGYLDKAQWLLVGEDESNQEVLERARRVAGMTGINQTAGPSDEPEQLEEEPEQVETPAVVYTGSLGDLKHAWKDTIHGDGGECPVCERFGKVYNRSINDTMARSLQWMADQATEHGLRTWIDVPNTAPIFVLRSNQLSTLRWWGLVERQLPDSESKSKHSGMWRITLKGMDFVEGTTQVPKKVFTYNGEVVSNSNDTTDFQSCKGKLFDYQKVMQSTHVALGKSLFPANDEHVQAA